ncbi:MAG: response regulator [Clostridium sp.]
MLKVIVADDEEKICQLIVKLVDWTSLGMEVAAIASNGIEAMEKIISLKPDIVITDIRMPGYDGLELIKRAKSEGINTEFIIISGYRHFEYAQNAIRYGVGDYLLKPIKKDELMDALKRIGERYRERNEQLSFEEKERLGLKNDSGRFRTNFFSSILYSSENIADGRELEEMNEQYHYHFSQGCFRMVTIKFDNIQSGGREILNFLADKTAALTEQLLGDICFDQEIYVESSYIYLMLNYKEEESKNIRRQLKVLLDELKVLESIVEGMDVTIGAGKSCDRLEQLRQSLQSSKWMVQQRLVAGTGKVIEEIPKTSSDIVDSDIFYNFNQNITKALESLDNHQVMQLIDGLKAQLIGYDNISGYEVLQMSKEVCNIYLFHMRNKKVSIDNESSFMESYNAGAEDCANVDELFGFLKKTIGESFLKAAQGKRMEDNRPIRLAKNYMKEHYMEQVTLEDISALAGFSSTYFSALFKKETGSAFLEYLQSIRMDEAKKLLKETNLSVIVICEKVGYSDVKYFTKSFIKHTGLKPGEYRKIYS